MFVVIFRLQRPYAGIAPDSDSVYYASGTEYPKLMRIDINGVTLRAAQQLFRFAHAVAEADLPDDFRAAAVWNDYALSRRVYDAEKFARRGERLSDYIGAALRQSVALIVRPFRAIRSSWLQRRKCPELFPNRSSRHRWEASTLQGRRPMLRCAYRGGHTGRGFLLYNR